MLIVRNEYLDTKNILTCYLHFAHASKSMEIRLKIKL